MSSTRDLSHYEINVARMPNWTQRKSNGAGLPFSAGFSRSRTKYARVSGVAEEGDSVDEGQPLTGSGEGGGQGTHARDGR